MERNTAELKRCSCGAVVNMLDGTGSSCSACGELHCSVKCGNGHYYAVHGKQKQRAEAAVNGFDDGQYQDAQKRTRR